MSPLIECHAHVLPDAVLARFAGGSSPGYVTAERRVLGRMLEAHDAHGVTHAIRGVNALPRPVDSDIVAP